MSESLCSEFDIFSVFPDPVTLLSEKSRFTNFGPTEGIPAQIAQRAKGLQRERRWVKPKAAHISPAGRYCAYPRHDVRSLARSACRII